MPIFEENAVQLPVSPTPQELDNLPPSPDNPPWNWVIALGAWIMSVLLLFFIPFFVLVPYATSQDIDLHNPEELQSFFMQDYVAVLLQTLLVIPIHAITLGFSWAIVTNFKKFPFFKTLGWKWGGFKFWHAIAIIFLFFVMASLLTDYFGLRDNDLVKVLKSSRTAVYIIAALATFTAPLVEEVIYRGLLYSAFQKRFGVPVAVIVVTILFAGVHFPQYWGDPATLISITVLSLTLTLTRAKTGNLLPCFALHTILNGIQSFYLVFQPVIDRFIERYTGPAAQGFIHLIK